MGLHINENGIITMLDKTSLINIMIVEDESIITIDIQNMLESLGYTIPAGALLGRKL